MGDVPLGENTAVELELDTVSTGASGADRDDDGAELDAATEADAAARAATAAAFGRTQEELAAGVVEEEDADSFMISIISHVPTTDEMLQLFDEGNHIADLACGEPLRASTTKGRTFKTMYNGKEWVRIRRCLRAHCLAAPVNPAN